MNIFYLHKSPEISAQMVCNSHCIKMIIESAQMLSTAHNILDNSNLPNLYKTTHKNHPSSVWVRSSFLHYSWLYKHFVALCDEYTYRYGKTHLTDSKLRNTLRNYPRAFSDGTYNWSPPPCCMPNECKISDDPVTNYRHYYNTYKSHIFKWKIREQPDWVL